MVSAEWGGMKVLVGGVWVLHYDVADTMVCEVCGQNPLVRAKKAYHRRCLLSSSALFTIILGVVYYLLSSLALFTIILGVVYYHPRRCLLSSSALFTIILGVVDYHRRC